MKKRIFTLMMAFLAVASGAVWGQSTGSGTEDNPWEIGISFMYNQTTAPAETTTDAYVITPWTETTGDNAYSNKLEIKKGGYYKLTGSESNIQIKVSADDPVHITVAEGIHIDASLDNTVKDPTNGGSEIFEDRCALQINSGAHVTLDWEGNAGTHVEFSSGGYRAGINVKPNATLVLKGTHEAELWGTCWNNQDGVYTSGAGIGGDSVEPDFGTIIIESGTVEGHCFAQFENWQAYGAGIGGGFKQGEHPNEVTNGKGSTKGTIIIKEGTVTATANYTHPYNTFSTTGRSAAIGGGYAGTCTNIAILGGTVNAETGNLADAIGVGEDYDNGITEGIVIGQWDEDSAEPTINNNPKINNTNLVKDGTLSGNVTMPDNTQVYIDNLNIGEGVTFNAYRLDLQRTVFNENHNVDWSGAETAENYYLGKGQNIEIDALKCNATEDKDLFLGWYNSNDNVVTIENEKTKFTAPTTGSLSSEAVTYYAVWVESVHPIVVETETEWTANGELTPEINYVPKDSEKQKDVLNALTFAFGDLTGYPELSNWKFDETYHNQILGKTVLQNDNTYKELELTATVKLGNGATQTISIPVYIVEASIINKVSINTNQKHIYTGDNHNGLDMNGQTHLLNVQMTKDLNGDDLDNAITLTEGTNYRIYSYLYDGNTVSASEDNKESVELIDAGEYSNITIEALQATVSADLDEDHGQQYTIKDGTVTIAQRPLNIYFSLSATEIEEGEVPNIGMVSVQYEYEQDGVNNNRGLVKEEQPSVSYAIDYVLNEEQTEMTVFITNVEVEDTGENGFKKSNYNIACEIDNQLYKLPGEKVGEDEKGVSEFPDASDPKEPGVEIGTIPVVPEETGEGGGTTDKRYQLYLANKDYLKTDEKTVEYYEDLKLELFSRHNKKYADAGGSFTIWYEKDGEANVGGYRLFWSKSGEHGDYQEVKFDPVSEYFRIDNVHSDVYVKIYDADGFPVANEAITAQDFRAYAQPNKISVITPEPTDVQIISMAGAVVAADKVTGQREFANLAEGVYIVRMGETIVKLQVRN